MDAKRRIVQETFHVPSDVEFCIDEMAELIDSEIKLERRGKNGETIKVDSVSIVRGDNGDIQFRYPFVRSGTEFRNYVKRLEWFNRIK